MYGVDPDLWTLGWARIEADFTRPSTAPPALKRVWVGVWTPEGKGKGDIDQANNMIASLNRHEAPWDRDKVLDRVYVAAEAQRVYPPRNEAPATVVAKANDLLRLAQISGAFQARFANPTYDTARSFKPDYWKHNAKKEAMHAAAIQRVDEHRTPVILWQGTESKGIPNPGGTLAQVYKALTKAAGRLDALDAVCLALFGIDELACGRWVA